LKRSMSRAVGALAAAAVFGMLGCSRPEAKDETVALVNGAAIKVVELREFLGVRGGLTPAAGIRAEKKMEALDRLIAGRLLEQEARAAGLDNTDEFRGIVRSSEQSALITALFRKELASKAKGSKEEIEAEVKKMMGADNTLSKERADVRAGRTVSDRQTRKVEEELIAAAGKEFPSQILQEAVDRIARGEDVPDDAVLATAASDNVTYGDVKRVLESVGGGMHGGQDMARNPMLIVRLLNREVTGKALAAYARKQGVEGSEWHKSVRGDIDRSILIELLAERIAEDEAQVNDREIEAAYKEHPERFVDEGRKIPLTAVKEQIRGALRNEKRKTAIDARIEELRKKATITIDEKVLSGV
jgi:hypothetical protein